MYTKPAGKAIIHNDAKTVTNKTDTFKNELVNVNVLVLVNVLKCKLVCSGEQFGNMFLSLQKLSNNESIIYTIIIVSKTGNNRIISSTAIITIYP